MSELEDRINSVLSDPAQLEKISEMARSIMAGAAGTPQDAPGGQGGAEGDILSGLGALLRGGAVKSSRQIDALKALAPCLDERRRAKLEKAIGLARAARIAKLGLSGAEGGDV